MLCNPLCAPDLPIFTGGCSQEKRQAGLKALLLMKCDVSVDLTDLAEVAAALTSGDLVVSYVGMGAKPVATSPKLQLNPCDVEESLQIYTHTMTFESGYVDLAGNTDFAAYNDLIVNSAGYRIVPIGCDDNIYPNPNWTALSTTEHIGLKWTIEGGNDIAANGNTAVQMYKLALSTLIRNWAVIPGINVPGLSNALGI